MLPSITVVDICDKPTVVKTGKYRMLQIEKTNRNFLKENASYLYVDVSTPTKKHSNKNHKKIKIKHKKHLLHL